MVQLTFSQLFQLYAPLAGLLVVVFWLGKLSEKVASHNRRLQKLEETDEGIDGRVSRLARMEANMLTMNDTLGKQGRSLDGVHRQLATIASKGLEFHASPGV